MAPKHKTAAAPSLLILLLATMALGLTACSGTSGSSSSSTSSSTITLYNGQHEQTTSLLVAGFE